MGYSVKASAEFEFFLFRETPETLQQKRFHDLTPLTARECSATPCCAPAHSSTAGLRHCPPDAGFRDARSRGIHTGTGPGVFEVALQYDHLGQGGRHTAALFKTAVKEIASRHGLTACFMAKWNLGSARMLRPPPPESVEQRRDRSRPSPRPAPQGKHGLQLSCLESYIAGQLEFMRDTCAIIAPTINSYKRMVPGRLGADPCGLGRGEPHHRSPAHHRPIAQVGRELNIAYLLRISIRIWRLRPPSAPACTGSPSPRPAMALGRPSAATPTPTAHPGTQWRCPPRSMKRWKSWTAASAFAPCLAKNSSITTS